MASRRKLKQTIKFVSSELITEVYFRCLMTKSIDVQKVENMILEITGLNREFISRTNHPNGVENPKLVKAYYRSLYADWQVAFEKIVKEIETLA